MSKLGRGGTEQLHDPALAQVRSKEKKQQATSTCIVCCLQQELECGWCSASTEGVFIVGVDNCSCLLVNRLNSRKPLVAVFYVSKKSSDLIIILLYYIANSRK